MRSCCDRRDFYTKCLHRPDRTERGCISPGHRMEYAMSVTNNLLRHCLRSTNLPCDQVARVTTDCFPGVVFNKKKGEVHSATFVRRMSIQCWACRREELVAQDGLIVSRFTSENAHGSDAAARFAPSATTDTPGVATRQNPAQCDLRPSALKQRTPGKIRAIRRLAPVPSNALAC